MVYLRAASTGPVKHGRSGIGLRLKHGALIGLGTVTTTRNDQRQDPLGMVNPHVQAGKSAHGQAHHMGLGNAQMVKQRDNVLHRPRLRIRRWVRGYV
jgi:hypothetical protein